MREFGEKHMRPQALLVKRKLDALLLQRASSFAWVESSAAVADGVVYVGSSDWMRVNAMDAATGQLKWYFQTEGVPWCSPTVSEGVIYIGATGGCFDALDAATDAEKWRVRTETTLIQN